MASETLTPVVAYGPWWAKRDDLAYADGVGASGAKVRQFMAMAAARPGAPIVVGCAAVSAQQVYVADAVRRTGTRGVVFVPQRSVYTAATAWAAGWVEVVPVSPGYRNVYMARAKARARAMGAIRWDRGLAVTDTMAQVANLPASCTRVVVPTGSGLVAAGVLAGLAAMGRKGTTVAIYAVSGMADLTDIQTVAAKHAPLLSVLPPATFARVGLPYNNAVGARLPCGTMLDPYYAAKVAQYVQPGDCLWVTGCRPLAAMPPLAGIITMATTPGDLPALG